MKTRYLIASLIAIALVGIGIASAHMTEQNIATNSANSMMANTGVHMGMNMNSMHSENETNQMKDHMNMTNEDFKEMADHCPMMS